MPTKTRASLLSAALVKRQLVKRQLVQTTRAEKVNDRADGPSQTSLIASVLESDYIVV
jgi:hypothetical protein